MSRPGPGGRRRSCRKASTVSFGSCFLGGVRDEPVEFVDPEGVEQRAELHESLWVEPVVPEASVLARSDQSRLGEHPEMLRYRRPARGEVCGEVVDGLFARCQQLHEASPGGLSCDFQLI